MKSDIELQKDVQDAIRWEPLLNAAEIGVIANDGVVTLTGTVDSYVKKLKVESITKHVKGVKAIAESIEIRFGTTTFKSDTEIAHEILIAFKWNWSVPNDVLEIQVENGWVTLEGELKWNYQKDAAEEVVKNINGVRGITNSITITADVDDEVEKQSILRAFHRNWSLTDEDLFVEVVGSKVLLTGKVHSLYQKEEAGRIASEAPGVMALENNLEIDFTLP